MNMITENMENPKKELLYQEVYDYFRDLILQNRLPAGSKMPSLRKCAQEMKYSRTTIENAYLQLAADGYIISRPQSGYYVTEIARTHEKKPDTKSRSSRRWLYDLASQGVDQESFRFDLWRRYIKSALRQDERLLSYGEPQGEEDFRMALADYIRERRNILCSPEDIVVGAGTQCLLNILCPLLKGKETVSFPNPSFEQGSTVFSDYGFQIHYRDKNADIIYVTPAHMTKWGEIMPVSRRLELIRYASEHNSLIIEDDFENEFVYLQKPTPSVYGLAGGKDVVYMGSFSRLLLPSIRISFMVLPSSLAEAYHKRAELYSQTASKAEQIALCQFIRDGHLGAQTRKLRRLYSQKLKELTKAIKSVFGVSAKIKAGSAGTSLAVTLPFHGSREQLKKQAQTKGLHLQFLEKSEESITLLFSCSAMPAKDFIPACRLLKDTMEQPDFR